MDGRGTAEISAIVDTYLTSQSRSADTPARLLADIIERNYKHGEEYDAAGPIYAKILDLIRSMKHDDPRQDALVSLVASLKSVQSTKLDWSSLNPLGITIRELWNADLETSLNAFVARLTASGVLLFDVYSIWAFRDSLEANASVEELDASVPPGTVWFIYASQYMWELCLKSEEIGPAARGGPLWTGFEGFNVERWEFWVERLKAIANEEGLNPEAKELVNKALDSAGQVVKK